MIAVFPPGEINNQSIENGDEKQRQRMRMGEAIQLIAAENTEYCNSQWVCPQGVEPKRGYERGLYYTMQHKIDSNEMPGSGEILCGAKQMISYEFVAVEGQIMPEEDPRKTI